nr:hypothetical protein [Nannocystis sp.]
MAKATAKPAAKPKPATKPAGNPAGKAAKPAAKPEKPATKVSKAVAAPEKPAKAVAKSRTAAAKPEPAPAVVAKPAKVAAKAVAKPEAKPDAKPAKPAGKPEPEAAAKPVAAKPVAAKPVAAKPAAAKPVARPAAPAKPAAKPAARKPTRSADDDDDDNTLDDDADVREAPTMSSRNVIDPADVIRFEPEAPPAPRKKSVLEVAEEDEDFEEDPPLPTADDVHGLLDRLRKAAQFGGDALEDLPRLIEQLEQIDDPAVMPRLLGLLEDNDPYGIYWNVLYVLEKFDDSYLKALLGSIEALHARAPQWAYTCVIRILNTRGDEDDCTAAFERLVNDGSAETRALVLKVLRELSADPDTDQDQKQNIARTITAIGGSVGGDAPPASAD